jgi:thioesterase domain-containing protein
MGGMVAFEMAQQLISQGEKVALLALLQASMPGFPASRFQRFRLSSQHQWFLCKTLLKFLATRYASRIVGISRERKQQVLDEVSKLILGWHGTSAQLPDETQATNTEIMYAYRPKPYGGNIHIILAEDCYESSGISQSLDPRRAWSGITKGKCVTHVLPGDHHSILVNANASRLAQRMRSLLDETAKDAEGA